MKFKCPHCDSKRIAVIESQYAITPLSKVTTQGYEVEVFAKSEIKNNKFEGIFCRDCEAEWARGEDYLIACGKVKFVFEDSINDKSKSKYKSDMAYSFMDDFRCLMNVDDNCEVEDILIKAKVFKNGNGVVSDPESSMFHISFQTKEQAMDFINSLNKFFGDPKNLRKIKKVLD